jgi:hypothetical protein
MVCGCVPQTEMVVIIVQKNNAHTIWSVATRQPLKTLHGHAKKSMRPIDPIVVIQHMVTSLDSRLPWGEGLHFQIVIKRRR